MKYPIAEKFKAPQGEGLYTGTPMAFIRFVGCSVGKNTCHGCDTDFEKMLPELGGGLYTPEELIAWAGDYIHICLTGGEPFDRELKQMYTKMRGANKAVHIETSGTVLPHHWNLPTNQYSFLWICVSPKPGYLPEMIERADEIKVIIGGLGDGKGWPIIGDAIRWAREGKLVYIQPRNEKLTIDNSRMQEAIDLVCKYPELRLSAQLHKYIRTR